MDEVLSCLTCSFLEKDEIRFKVGLYRIASGLCDQDI